MDLLLALGPPLATAITWLLGTGKSSLDMWAQLKALKGERREGVLEALAFDERHKKNMRELYLCLDVAQPKAETILRRRRRRNVLVGTAVVAAAIAAWFLVWLLVGIVERTWPLAATAAAVGVVMAWLPSRFLPVLPDVTELKSQLAKAQRRVAGFGEGVQTDLAEQVTRLERLGGAEFEKEFLAQFLATQRVVEGMEAVLLCNQLTDGQRKLEDAYSDQIAKLLANKLEELLLDPEYQPLETSDHFAEIAYQELERLGYTDLLSFEKADIDKLVTDDVIRSYRNGRPLYLVKQIQSWPPLCRARAQERKRTPSPFIPSWLYG